MCRILFYTIDNVLMNNWLQHLRRHCASVACERCQAYGQCESYGASDACASHSSDAHMGGPRADARYRFLSDSAREQSLISWVSGIVKHPPSSEYARTGHTAHAAGTDHKAHTAHTAHSVHTAPWLPPRRTLLLHCTIEPDAYNCLLERGQLAKHGDPNHAHLQPTERDFMNSIKPLLGIWYGRLVFIRSGDQPCLVAQVNTQAWNELYATARRLSETEYLPLLENPPAWAVLWPGGDVIEMFGAESGELCCCSLVENARIVEVEALESSFLNALGLALLSSAEGTVLLDIDADYAESYSVSPISQELRILPEPGPELYRRA